jgi:hypothetical protein
MIRKIDLVSDTELVEAIKTSKVVMDKLVELGVKEDMVGKVLEELVPMILGLVQSGIEYDKVVEESVLDGGGKVIQTVIFHKVSAPYADTMIEQVSSNEIDRRLLVVTEDKARVVEEKDKVIAEVVSLRDKIVASSVVAIGAGKGAVIDDGKIE